MQEEVNQRTMALSIRASKLTGKVLAAAFSKVVRAAKAHHQKALTPKVYRLSLCVGRLQPVHFL